MTAETGLVSRCQSVRTGTWQKYFLSTYNNQGGVIELVFTVDIDSRRYQFLAPLKVASTASLQELLKLGTKIEGVLVPKYPASNQLVLLLDFGFQLVFSKD